MQIENLGFDRWYFFKGLAVFGHRVDYDRKTYGFVNLAWKSLGC